MVGSGSPRRAVSNLVQAGLTSLLEGDVDSLLPAWDSRSIPSTKDHSDETLLSHFRIFVTSDFFFGTIRPAVQAIACNRRRQAAYGRGSCSDRAKPAQTASRAGISNQEK